jgi:lipopolysaccharide transport system permease protein
MRTDQPLDQEPTTVIRPRKGWVGVDLRELWEYRELIYFLMWRDIKVRYKQTLLGAGWAILKPLFSMILFNFIFNRLAGLSTDGIPGPVFYYSGFLLWILFQDGVNKSSASLVAGRNLITKVYFPRLSVPIASVTAGIVDFAIAFVVLLGIMLFFQVPLTSNIWILPVFILLALIAALGVGLWFSALNVAYRDVGYVTPFILQAWLFASPVAYSAKIIPEGPLQFLYGLNPMAGVIQGFRWALVGTDPPSVLMMTASVLSACLILFSGILYFRRTERTFADIV